MSCFLLSFPLLSCPAALLRLPHTWYCYLIWPSYFHSTLSVRLVPFRSRHHQNHDPHPTTTITTTTGSGDRGRPGRPRQRRRQGGGGAAAAGVVQEEGERAGHGGAQVHVRLQEVHRGRRAVGRPGGEHRHSGSLPPPEGRGAGLATVPTP